MAPQLSSCCSCEEEEEERENGGDSDDDEELSEELVDAALLRGFSGVRDLFLGGGLEVT